MSFLSIYNVCKIKGIKQWLKNKTKNKKQAKIEKFKKIFKYKWNRLKINRFT